MQVLHGFWRILQATSFMFVVGLLSINHAFAADISIFNWTANVDNSTVSGVARCGPKSGATSTGVKSWVTSNWTNQTGGCFCRVVGIDDVSDWNNLDDAGSNWYGSGTNFSGGFEECSQNCAATCAQKFESDDYYQENICGGTCPVVSPVGTQYTINYDMDGGTGCETVQTYTESATICEPTREGYTFDGWMDNNTSETYSGGDVVYNVNLDLVAFWTEIPGTRYTILYDTNGGTGCADTEYVISTTLCTPSREAYHFDGWVDADTQNIYNGGATVSDIDLILTAQWTFVGCANGQYFENNVCNTCVSGYTSDGATATSQNDCYRSCTTDDIDNSTAVDGTYYYDGTNTCNATSCYTGWHVNGTTCEIDTYTIVYNSNGGTEYTDGSYTIESDTITLPVPVRDGYEFDGWYDNADFYGSPITEITYGSTGNKEYHAKWIKLPCNNNYYGDGFVCDTCPVAYPNSDNTDNNDITRC